MQSHEDDDVVEVGSHFRTHTNLSHELTELTEILDEISRRFHEHGMITHTR
jgi:hypothetical protein